MGSVVSDYFIKSYSYEKKAAWNDFIPTLARALLYLGVMKTAIHHILITTALVLIMIQAPGAAAQEGPTEHELAVIAYINQAREDPLGMAESMGMDPNQILEDFPDWSELLENGMLPLLPDERLRESASVHVEDMLENNYYGKVSPDGATPEDRIIAAGYAPETCGESIGMRGFVNFIPAEEAAWKLFEKMFENELDPAWTGERNILNPDFREVGVRMMAGAYSVSDVPWNVYMIVCDFGMEQQDLKVERILIARINEARMNPLAVLDALEIDAEDAAEALGDDAGVLIHGLPPLARDEQLHEAAWAHNLDMLENLYLSHVSPDGAQPMDRVADADYDALMCDEIIGARISEGAEDPWEIADTLFEEAVRNELGGVSAERLIFNPEPTEIGVAFTSMALDADRAIHLIVVVAAKPAEARWFALGSVFMDGNGDQIFDPGEEAQGLQVSLRYYYDQQEIMAETETDIVGGWKLPMPLIHPFLLIVLDSEDVLMYEHAIAAAGENVQHDIPIPTGD